MDIKSDSIPRLPLVPPITGVLGQHYLAQEPHVYLGIEGDPFSLFYDYDQTRDKKLSKLKASEKSLWLRARMEMVFLEPLRQLWEKSSDIFRRLMLTSPEQERNCSFSVAAMVIMLNGVEAIGGFLVPDIAIGRPGANKKRFYAFIERYMTPWVPISDILWRDFRNGIAHGFQIQTPHSLEFLSERKFEQKVGIVYVCPIHFFYDLEIAMANFFEALRTDKQLLEKFEKGFGKVYPC